MAATPETSSELICLRSFCLVSLYLLIQTSRSNFLNDLRREQICVGQSGHFDAVDDGLANGLLAVQKRLLDQTCEGERKGKQSTISSKYSATLPSPYALIDCVSACVLTLNDLLLRFDLSVCDEQIARVLRDSHSNLCAHVVETVEQHCEEL